MSGFGAETHPILGPILAIGTILMVFNAPKALGFAAQEALTGARSLVRMTERATVTSIMAGGAEASGVGSVGSAAPLVTVVGAAASAGHAESAWDGPSFGAPTAPALPPPHDSERA